MQQSPFSLMPAAILVDGRPLTDDTDLSPEMQCIAYAVRHACKQGVNVRATLGRRHHNVNVSVDGRTVFTSRRKYDPHYHAAASRFILSRVS